MQNNEHIIDVQFREVGRKPAPWWVLLFPLSAAAGGFGAVFDIWTGQVAMCLLMFIGALALLVGMNIKKGRRISSIYGLTAITGMASLAFAWATTSPLLSGGAICVAGLCILALVKIERRGWEYA
jgi:hypothetical protein